MNVTRNLTQNVSTDLIYFLGADFMHAAKMRLGTGLGTVITARPALQLDTQSDAFICQRREAHFGNCGSEYRDRRDIER